MEQDLQKMPSVEMGEPADEMSNVLVVEVESFVNVELNMEDDDNNNSNNNDSVSTDGHPGPAITQGKCHDLTCSLLKY